MVADISELIAQIDAGNAIPSEEFVGTYSFDEAWTLVCLVPVSDLLVV